MKSNPSKTTLARFATLFCTACLLLSVTACDNNASSNRSGGSIEELTEIERQILCDEGEEIYCGID